LAGFALFSALGAFFAGVAFFLDLPLSGATSGLCLRALAFFSGFGSGFTSWLAASAATFVTCCSATAFIV
jgi:hypothetical protein